MSMFRILSRGYASLRCAGSPFSSTVVAPIFASHVPTYTAARHDPHPSPRLSFSTATNSVLDDDGGSIMPPSPRKEDFAEMTNEELEDNSTIPGWNLIHCPPRKFPRGALVGTVVSTKMQKTINVAVDRYRIAPIVRKRLRYTRKFFAHDEEEVANEGDLVMITPCHRMSKHKHFMLREIIRHKGTLK